MSLNLLFSISVYTRAIDPQPNHELQALTDRYLRLLLVVQGHKMTSSDPYTALGIAPGANEIEIRAAYSAILKSLHIGGLAHTEIKSRLETARAAYKSLTDPLVADRDQVGQATNVNRAMPLQADSSRGVASIRFTGAAGEYFRIWIVNVCLSVLTLGIYSAWAKVRRKRYFYGNTLLHDSGFEYLANPKIILKGRLIMVAVILAVTLANQFLHLNVLGLLYIVLLPYIVIKAARFNAINSSYRNVRFNFGSNFPAPNGRLLASIRGYRATSQFLILPVILVPLSLGLLYPYYAFRKRQFMLEHSSYGKAIFGFDARPGAFYLVYFKTTLVFVACMLAGVLTLGIGLLPFYILFASYRDAAVGRVTWRHTTLGQLRFDCTWRTRDLFKLNLLNTLAILLSLGLMVPWAEIRTARYQLQGLTLTPAGELGKFVASEQDNVDAIGDEAADFLGFDFGL